MMGPAHALMGATGGIMTALVMNMPVQTVFISGLISAGAALWPDADHTSGTFRHTFGLPGLWISQAIDWFSNLIYLATKSSHEPVKTGGHRTLTHTIIFNILFGFGLWKLFDIAWAQVILIFIFTLLGMRALLSKGIGPFIPFYLPKSRNLAFPRNKIKKQKRKASRKALLKISKTGTLLSAIFLAGLFAIQMLPLYNPLELAIIITAGALIHLAGDALTTSGVPLLWPIPIKGKLWYRVKAPLTFDTGSEVETDIVTPLCFLVLIGLSIWVFMI